MIVPWRDASLLTEVKLSEGCRLIATGVGRKADVSEWSQTMGLNRQDKAAVIEEMRGIVANTSAIVIAEYRGLTVEAVTKLRANARQQGVQLRVVKNTLVRRAVEGTAFADLAEKFSGPLVYAFSADPVAAAKVLAQFAKENDKLVIKGGAMANYVMDVEGVKQLASMPSREELLAKLMATMNEPVAKLVRTINEVPARFVRTVAAYRDAQEKAAA